MGFGHVLCHYNIKRLAPRRLAVSIWMQVLF